MLKFYPNGKIDVKAGHFEGPDVPEFELRRMVFEAPGGLIIDQNFFNEVKAAKDNIFNVIRIEEDFDTVLLSYLEFEKELINYSLEQMVFHNLEYFGFQGQRNNINRRLGATLSAVRAYIDHTDRVLCKMFDPNGRIRQEFLKVKSTHYDEHFEYRAMETLRNYSQHCDILIHSLTHHLKWVGEGENRVLEFSIEPKMVPKYFLDEKDKIKKNVRDEVATKGESISIQAVIRRYISCLGDVHENLRVLLSDDLKTWEELIYEVFKTYENSFLEDKNKPGLALIRRDGDKNVIEEIGIFPQFIEYRKQLEKKNSSLGLIHTRTVRS